MSVSTSRNGPTRSPSWAWCRNGLSAFTVYRVRRPTRVAVSYSSMAVLCYSGTATPAPAPAASAPNAAAVSATTAASRSQGSQQQAARSGPPNGPRVVTARTAAAPASIVSGIRSCAAGPPAMFHRQCSAAPEQGAETGQQPEGGRGAAAEQVPAAPAAARRRQAGLSAGRGGSLRRVLDPAAVMAAVPG